MTIEGVSHSLTGMLVAGQAQLRRAPAARDVLALMKPITWFPPMWAFACGVASSGVSLADRWPFLIGGLILTGPLVCGASQAVNDWFDRDVDAINEPGRPIPSGRIPGRWGLWIAVAGSVASLPVAAALGPVVFWATLVALAIGWAYSAPPLRLKRSGWWGPGACALAYEGLTWFTGAAAMAGGWPGARVLLIAALYAAGAHGIMTMNDFKAVAGDRATGLRSLPVVLGVERAARLACAVMLVPQIVVVALLVGWQLPWSAGAVALGIAGQLWAMRRLLADPKGRAPWFNATGTGLYVLGMMAAALGLGSAA